MAALGAALACVSGGARAISDEDALARMAARPDVAIERNLDYLHWKADEAEFDRKNLTWTSIGRDNPAARPPSRMAFFTGGFLGGFLGVLAYEAVAGGGKRLTAGNVGTALAAGGAFGLVGIGFSFRVAPFNPRTSLDAEPDAPLDRSPVVREWSRVAREPAEPPAPPGY